MHVGLQATQAYLEGDKALAKKLGANGRWHAAQMAKAHAAASEYIFRQRNPTPKGDRCLGHCGCLIEAIQCHMPYVASHLALYSCECFHRLPSRHGS